MAIASLEAKAREAARRLLVVPPRAARRGVLVLQLITCWLSEQMALRLTGRTSQNRVIEKTPRRVQIETARKSLNQTRGGRRRSSTENVCLRYADRSRRMRTMVWTAIRLMRAPIMRRRRMPTAGRRRTRDWKEDWKRKAAHRTQSRASS